MTDKKQPPRTKAARTDWSAELNELNELANSHSFPAAESVYQHTYTPAPPGATTHVVVKGTVPAKSSTPSLVRVPDALRERIKSECAGPWTAALVGLADAQLKYLADTGQSLTVENKESQ